MICELLWTLLFDFLNVYSTHFQRTHEVAYNKIHAHNAATNKNIIIIQEEEDTNMPNIESNIDHCD